MPAYNSDPAASLHRLVPCCVVGTIMIANPSTPANYFHLLRRQVYTIISTEYGCNIGYGRADADWGCW
jgi:2-oxoglutarate dehydrogenase complex dehydrogenase (E1) component-like enzyme